MKIKKYLSAIIVTTVLVFGTQSCFQDLDNDPAFDYPEGFPDPTGEYNREKLNISFDGDVYDKSTYQFVNSGIGTFSFVDGVQGKAYKGDSDTTYVLVNSHPAISTIVAGEITKLGSFTVSFWMNSSRNTAATGLFSIANTKTFWSNLDIFLENTNSETQAFFKMHIYNERTGTRIEKWVEARVDDVFGKWVHMVFVYDAATSTVNIYRNGTKVIERVLADLGELQFKDVGPMVIGTLPFQAKPSLTSGASNQSWAGWYKGAFDQFHFYNEALSEGEIKGLYDNKN